MKVHRLDAEAHGWAAIGCTFDYRYGIFEIRIGVLLITVWQRNVATASTEPEDPIDYDALYRDAAFLEAKQYLERWDDADDR